MPLLDIVETDSQFSHFTFANSPLTSLEQVDLCLDQMDGTCNRLNGLIKKIDAYLSLPEEDKTAVKYKRLVSAINDGLGLKLEDKSLKLNSLKKYLQQQKANLQHNVSEVAKKLISFYKNQGWINFNFWENGSQQITYTFLSRRKFEKYKKMAEPPSTDEQVSDDNSYFHAFYLFILQEWRALTARPVEQVINSHAYFHAFRLFVLRGLRLIGLFSSAILFLTTLCFTYKVVMGILSVTYVVGVVFTIVDTYHASLRSNGSFDWDLFKSALQENGWRRPFLLLNDLVWTVVNAVSFGLFLGHSPLVRSNTIWNTILADHEAVNISDALSDDINLLGFMIDVPGDGGSAYLRKKSVEGTAAFDSGDIDFYLVHNHSKKTIADKQYRFRRAIIVAPIILLGMCLVYMSSLLPGIVLFSITAGTYKIIGASLAFSGSLIGGFGGRLWDTETFKNITDICFEKLDVLKEMLFSSSPPPVAHASVVPPSSRYKLSMRVVLEEKSGDMKTLGNIGYSKQILSSLNVSRETGRGRRSRGTRLTSPKLENNLARKSHGKPGATRSRSSLTSSSSRFSFTNAARSRSSLTSYGSSFSFSNAARSRSSLTSSSSSFSFSNAARSRSSLTSFRGLSPMPLDLDSAFDPLNDSHLPMASSTSDSRLKKKIKRRGSSR